MNVILFGATGMVGQGVLRECLRRDVVEGVVAVGRSASGMTHPKLRELVLSDMFAFDHQTNPAFDDQASPAFDGQTNLAFDSRANLEGYDACFFCLGVSAAGMNEVDYTRLTFDLTTGWARLLTRINPALTFIYVSGAGTGGKAMWAQVKGRTENALLELFPKAYMFRLAALARLVTRTYCIARPSGLKSGPVIPRVNRSAIG